MVKLQPSKLAMRVRFPLPAFRAGREWIMDGLRKNLLLSFVVLAIPAGFWVATSPAAPSRDSSPATLIQAALPPRMTIEKASKSDLLSAVCFAVRKNRNSAPGIATAAVAARGEFAGDIVGTVLRCMGKVECEKVGAIVKATVSARPGAAQAISDAAVALAPKCDQSIDAEVRAAMKTSSPSPNGQSSPGTTGSDAEREYDPHEELTLVCVEGTQRAIRQSLLTEFLRGHPGASTGRCSPTPTPLPRPATSVAPVPRPIQP